MKAAAPKADLLIMGSHAAAVVVVAAAIATAAVLQLHAPVAHQRQLGCVDYLKYKCRSRQLLLLLAATATYAS